MKRNLFGSVLAILLLAGCADPAENVPKASVSTNSTASADAASSAGDGAKAAATASNPAAGAKAYAITPENSKVEFTGSKVTGKHDGGFKQLQGEVHVAGTAVQHAKVTIQTDSLHSDNDRLTGHLKSPDFFDTAKYPTAVFETTSITGSGANATVKGKLTLHGETKEISFPANIEVKDDAVTVKAEFSINRHDFNMKYAGKADDLIRDMVVLRLDVKATPKQA
ncbi:MAG TPA: YceI family protein [Verrucomicrobiae bacterium]